MSDLRDITRSLQLEYCYIHLVYHRNNNQHRKTHWWRQFSIFKRSINRILQRLNRSGGNRRKKENASLQDIVEEPEVQMLIRKFLKFQLPSIYREFQNVLTMGQFVTLAVVLIGLLARCRSLLLKLQSEEEGEGEGERERESVTAIDEMRFIKKVDEDLGMEVVIEEEEVGEGEHSIETKIVDQDIATIDFVDNTDKKKSKKKSKKKKKKKSVIDDIFG